MEITRRDILSVGGKLLMIASVGATFEQITGAETPPDSYRMADRAALDYATELTRDKQVNPGTFARMAGFYSERAICEVVWLVASEHFYNMTNIGLNIRSDMLCDISKKKKLA